MNNLIKFELGTHHGNEVIFILFEKNTVLNERVKKLLGVKWSQTRKA
jgi:hypothetical protein